MARMMTRTKTLQGVGNGLRETAAEARSCEEQPVRIIFYAGDKLCVSKRRYGKLLIQQARACIGEGTGNNDCSSLPVEVNAMAG